MRGVDRREFGLLAAAGLSGCATGAATGPVAGVDSYMRRVAAFDFTGAVLVKQEGRVLLSQAYGFCDRAAATPFTTRTPFNIGSITKPITACVVMKLVEQGKLALSDPLSRFVPDAPADKAAITIVQLLSHSAGLTRDSARNYPMAIRAQALAIAMAAPLNTAPGAQMAYSNDGYRVLAAIAEIVTQREFPEIVRELVFRPAGMREAGFVNEDIWPRGSIAIGYNEWSKIGTFQEGSRDRWKREGAGSVVASLADLERFRDAFFAGRIVSAASVAQMTTVHAREPGEDGDAYGLGWFVTETADHSPLIFHGGDVPGYHCELRWYPSEQRAIIVLTTQELYDESGSGLGVQKRLIASNISRVLGAIAFEPPPEARLPNAAEAAALLGAYRTAEGGALTIYSPSHNPADLWIGAVGQDAVNALQGTDANRRALCARFNARSMALVEAMAARDRAALGRLLSEDSHFMIGGLIGDFESFSREHGAYQGAYLIGTRHDLGGPANLRTMFNLRFASGAYDLSFTWHGETLYETLTQTGALFIAMLPIAMTGQDALAAYDFVFQRALAFRAARNASASTYTRLIIGDLNATRVSA